MNVFISAGWVCGQTFTETINLNWTSKATEMTGGGAKYNGFYLLNLGPPPDFFSGTTFTECYYLCRVVMSAELYRNCPIELDQHSDGDEGGGAKFNGF